MLNETSLNHHILEVPKARSMFQNFSRFHVPFYRPRSEASEGYVFTFICLSVTEQGGGDTR